jgi:hypothetical protein
MTASAGPQHTVPGVRQPGNRARLSLSSAAGLSGHDTAGQTRTGFEEANPSAALADTSTVVSSDPP